MRVLSSIAATFVDCDFSNANLHKIDFQSSGFVRCRFAGELREVIFWNHGFQTGKPDPNPMEDVDFSGAVLRDVEFRRLDLGRVRLPEDPDHLIVRPYRCVLERALERLKGRGGPEAAVLSVVLAHSLKWAGPNQEAGVFNKRDLADGGPEGARFAEKLLRQAEQECQGR